MGAQMEVFKFKDVEQNTDEWFSLRAGRLTSSKLGIVMAQPRDLIVTDIGKSVFAIVNMQNKKAFAKRYESKVLAEIALNDMKKKDMSKSFGIPAQQYAINIAIEQITGNPIASTYTNEHMQRGHDQEPVARELYEDNYFCDVTNGGFFESEFIGCSPDGLVDEDGVIEIKSVISSVHYANIKRQNVDPAYKWQCIGNLMFTNRDWIDFISYCEEFPEGKQLFVKRLHKKDLNEEFKLLNERVIEFKSLIEKSKTLILESNYSN
jgi:hypothetical protein